MLGAPRARASINATAARPTSRSGRSAREGDPKAQHYVGHIFEKGLGVDPNYAEAARWYKKAAEADNTRAMISLAQLHEKGLGVEQNLQLASEWYARALGTPPQLDPQSLARESAQTQSSESERIQAQKIKQLSSQLTKTQQQLQDKHQQSRQVHQNYKDQLQALVDEKARLQQSGQSQSALIEELQQALNLRLARTPPDWR